MAEGGNVDGVVISGLRAGGGRWRLCTQSGRRSDDRRGGMDAIVNDRFREHG
jgi:hypothetical protein